MGRLAWSAGSLLHILPVSYAMYAGNVVFRTSPYGDLAHLQHPTNVAFEIDHVDDTAGTGWSVVVQGRAQGVTLPQELVGLWAREDIAPWAAGHRTPRRTAARASDPSSRPRFRIRSWRERS